MSTAVTPIKTADQIALERFDQDRMPDDAFFLAKFKSKIEPRPSEEIVGKLHFSALTLEEELAAEKKTLSREPKKSVARGARGRTASAT